MPDIETTLASYLDGRGLPRTAARIAVEQEADALMERLHYAECGPFVLRWSNPQGGFTVTDTRRKPRWVNASHRRAYRAHAPGACEVFSQTADERRQWAFGPEGGGL